MSNSDRLSELLLEWEARRANNQHVEAAELCANSPELAAELQLQIDRIRMMEELLGETISGSSIETTNDAPPQSNMPTVEGYELQEVLDRGGMGVVYKAKQIELQRIVALKMMHEFHLSERRVARFRIEAEAVAKIQHTNIVQIFECGESDGRPWFSMEYVPGGSLGDFIKRGLPDPRETAELVLTLAIAVHATHEHGIVHRDLKPSNVLLTATGMPKFADFGLAKKLDAESEHTRTGEILGTPSYMAPEQAEGATDQIGPAVDVYAIGIILYEMLVGEPPLKGLAPLEALRRVTSEESVFPPESRGKIPRDLQLICLKCLRKKPSERYANAALLADDVERFLTGRPINAESIGPIRRAAKWVRRRPDLAALILACVGLVIALAFMAGDRYRAERNTRELAIELAPQALEILNRNCAECHGGSKRPAEKQLNVLNHASLLSSARSIVVPGAPSDSRLIQRIADGSMPPEEDEQRLPRVSEQELRILNNWIAGGAPAFPVADEQNPTPPVVPHSSIAAEARDVFQQHCYACHRYDVARGGIKILNHRLLLTVRKVVVPGLPDESELYHIINVDDDDESLMPPTGQSRLSEAEVKIVKRWIMEGAAPFPKRLLAPQK